MENHAIESEIDFDRSDLIDSLYLQIKHFAIFTSSFLHILRLLEAPCNRPFLNLWYQHSQLVLLAFFPWIVFQITYLLFFTPQTVRIVIRRNWRVHLNVHNFHFFIYSLLCVLFRPFFVFIIFVLFSDGGTSFGTHFERLDILLWPWLKPADFRVVNTETCVIGGVQKRNTRNGSILAEW